MSRLTHRRARMPAPPRPIPLAVILLVMAAAPCSLPAAPGYPWHHDRPTGGTLASRITAPEGYERLPAADRSFASWLRGLPLRPPGSPVLLFDGRKKQDQGGVYAVLDVDVGTRDLQQCADVLIRLRAEYLRQAGCADDISFDFTSGDPARWSDWRKGRRPVVKGKTVSWVKRAGPDASYASFRHYLDSVFTYAGSYSLEHELEAVEDPARVRPGDAFITGGFPGHAVLVADVVVAPTGQRAFLLVQGYTPAQDAHVLRNPAAGDSPWYPARGTGTLITPDWIFSYSDLRRFPATDCHTTAASARPTASSEGHD